MTPSDLSHIQSHATEQALRRQNVASCLDTGIITGAQANAALRQIDEHEPTCWQDIVNEQRALRMYRTGMLGRLPGTLEDEARFLAQCRAAVNFAERDQPEDN